MTASWVGGFPSGGDAYITLWKYSVSLKVNFMLCIFHHNEKNQSSLKSFFSSVQKKVLIFKECFLSILKNKPHCSKTKV